ncbi:hypothetical protein M1446_05665 [Candidatus Dependentiae bacterium]|nr:hypothetical protein [Candidatus Dependentiae bacterium]
MNLLEFLSAWFLGMITTFILNENEPLAHCRNTMLELEEELENLRKFNPKPASYYSDKIQNIKIILKKLNVHHAGLFIKNKSLQQLIDVSLERIKTWEIYPNEPHNEISSIRVELSEIWGDNSDRIYECKRIKEIQMFLHSGLIMRFCFRMYEIVCIYCSKNYIYF